MAAPSRWASLSPDQMSEIVRRVPCEWDRAHMAFACRSWCAGLAASPPPPPALPQLLLPSDGLTRVSCILSGSSIHQEYRDKVGVRYIGSCDGGYLFLAKDQSRLHRLRDILQPGVDPMLPDVVFPLYDASVQDFPSMVILAATLSSPPDVPGCVAAGIVAYQRDVEGPPERRCAFWLIGDRVAYDTRPPHCAEAMEDVMYRDDGFFHFLTDEEHILACAPTFSPVGDDQLRRVALSSTLRRCVPRDRDHEGNVRARYLLESRGELLMVVRFAPDHDSPTSGFKVFSTVGHPWSWGELDTLGGRMLFLGRGCSRSYETAEYPGFEDGIYFLDDRSFYDEHIMFRGVSERQYPCSDIGKWTQGQPPNVEFFFPEQVHSNHTSPAWLLPRPRRPVCLPKDILIEIGRLLRCDAGRNRVHRACRLPLADLGAAPLPQLPWLLRPFVTGPSFSCLTCGNVGQSVVHYVRAPTDARGAQYRYFGSYDGRWVFLADGQVHKLMNILSGRVYLLPRRVSYPRNSRDDMTILAATLSSSPDKEGCVVAAVVLMPYLKKPKGIVFWKMNSDVAFDPFAPSCPKIDPEDVIFYNSSFHFVTTASEIVIWTPDLSHGFLSLDNWSVYRVEYRTNEPQPKSRQIHARYLVSSRGELLLVLKWAPKKSQPAGSFKVFNVTGLDEIKPHFAPCVCTELKSLDGRMLFLGRGHSRCYETSDFPGFHSGIYFLDDRCSNKAPYPCIDNGRWLPGPPPVIAYCFEPFEDKSDYSSLVWILP